MWYFLRSSIRYSNHSTRDFDALQRGGAVIKFHSDNDKNRNGIEDADRDARNFGS